MSDILEHMNILVNNRLEADSGLATNWSLVYDEFKSLQAQLDKLTECLRVRGCDPSQAYSNQCQGCKNKQLVDNEFSGGGE